MRLLVLVFKIYSLLLGVLLDDVFKIIKQSIDKMLGLLMNSVYAFLKKLIINNKIFSNNRFEKKNFFEYINREIIVIKYYINTNLQLFSTSFEPAIFCRIRFCNSQ